MKKALVVLAAVLLVLAVGRSDEEVVETVEGREQEIEVLDRNVRLDFKLVPEEEDDDPFFIVTAIAGFEMSARFEGEEGRAEFSIGGSVDFVEEDRLLVILEAELAFAGEEGEAEFGVVCGVLLVPGEEREVASMGDRTLVVRASFADVEKEEE